jgi:hypothetical protein
MAVSHCNALSSVPSRDLVALCSSAIPGFRLEKKKIEILKIKAVYSLRNLNLAFLFFP